MADSPNLGDEERAKRRQEKKEKKEKKEQRRQERHSRHAAEEHRRSGQPERAALQGNHDPNPTIVLDTQQSTNSVEILSPRRAMPSVVDRATPGASSQVQATASPRQQTADGGRGGSHRKRGREAGDQAVGATPTATAAPERHSLLLSANAAGSSSPLSGLPAGAIQINKQLVDVSQLKVLLNSSSGGDRSRGSQRPTQSGHGTGQKYEIFTEALFGPRVLLEDITDPAKPIILLPNGINGASAVTEGHSYRTTRFVGAHPICAGAFEACDYLGPANFMSRSQLFHLTEGETRKNGGGHDEANNADGGQGAEFKPNGWQMYVASRQGQSLRSIAQEWKQLPAEEKALFRARAAVLFE